MPIETLVTPSFMNRPGQPRKGRAQMPEAHDKNEVLVELCGSPVPGPIRRPRPHAITHAITQAGDAGGGGLEVYIRIHALERIFTEAGDSPGVETGGLLVGDRAEDDLGPYVQVIAALPARLAPQSSTSLTFTHEAWAAMMAERERLYPNQGIVGWHHTHPGMRVFLSAPDQFIHTSFFAHPHDIAVVIDPESLEWGVFRWHGDCLELARRFFVYGEEPDDGRRLAQMLRELGAGTERGAIQ